MHQLSMNYAIYFNKKYKRFFSFPPGRWERAKGSQLL